MNGERGFARTAFLAEERENLHGVIIATSHHASKSCVDSVMALWRHACTPRRDGIPESGRAGAGEGFRPA
jgi:hypothetical protein